jgi:DNA-binding NtrC family response regulator
MNSAWQVAVVSADLENRHAITRTLFGLEVDFLCVSTVKQYRETARNRDVKLVFCENRLPDGDYRDVLAAADARSARKHPKVVIMARHLSPDCYQQAKRAGIFEAIPTPCRPTDIEWMVILAKKQDRMHARAGAQPAL